MLKEKGFTLIELLIVIAIVAILAGAMVPMFRVTKLEAQQARVQADLDTVKTASMMLHHDTGTWPAVGTVGFGVVTNDDGTGTTIPNWAGPYMDQWRDDPWGTAALPRPYVIYNVVVGTVTTRRVQSLGADGVDNDPEVTGANADITLLITPDITL